MQKKHPSYIVKKKSLIIKYNKISRNVGCNVTI